VADETWTMPINPDSVTDLNLLARSMQFARGARDQRVRTFVGKPGEKPYNWGGVIRTQAHYDQLVAWAEKTNPIEVTDHLSRTMRVFVVAFEPADRPPTKLLNWRLRYTMKTILLGGLT
jgi:hypothetical protein